MKEGPAWQTRRIDLWRGTQTPVFHKGLTARFFMKFLASCIIGLSKEIGQLYFAQQENPELRGPSGSSEKGPFVLNVIS